MRRGLWASELDRLRAASIENVITARELVRLGVPERTSYRRTQQDGPWTLLLPATFMLSNGEPTRRQREIAALLYAGADAMLTGLSAARHHGLRRGDDPDDVHVLVPEPRQVRSVGFVIVERTRRMPRAVLRDDLPVAPVGRSVLDWTRRTKQLDAIAAVLTEPVQRRMVLPETLRAELDAGCRKGSAAPRRVLRAIEHGVRSAAEFEAHEWWVASGLPEAEWNVPIYDEDGRLLGIADALVRDAGFVWEVDSVEEHFATPEQVQSTAQRRRGLIGAGMYVTTTRPSQRRDDPAGVRRDIVQGLAIARLMPAPRVSFGTPRRSVA